MNIKLFNMQLGLEMPQEDNIEMPSDNDILALKSVASLSTISFGESASEDPSILDHNMFYHLSDKTRSKLSLVKSSPDGLSNEALHGNWPWLWNKYLYGFGGGTVSYLKAVKSMEASLFECDNEEVKMVLSLIRGIESGNERFSYVSLGCGDGRKDSSIIGGSNLFSCYYPIDINSSLIKVAFNEVCKVSSRSFNYGGYIGDFTKLPTSLASRIGSSKKVDRKVFLCLGHTIGNYQENLVLDSIYRVMGAFDYAIISFEKQRDDSEVRYKSSENTDFLLNPFKSIDAYSYVRHRYLRQSLVTGLSDVGPGVQSHLFSLGFPNGLSLRPRHIIWTNRYYGFHIEVFFKAHKKFELIKMEEGIHNIVVLLKKKNDLSGKIRICKTLLRKWKKEQNTEDYAARIEDYMNHYPNKTDSVFLDRIISFDRLTARRLETELSSFCKEISKSKK